MKKRSLLMMLLLTIITLGIYEVVWYVKFQMELKAQTGKGFGGLAHFLLTIVTFGIYFIYWQYAAGKRLAEQGLEDQSVLYLILAFVFPVINPYLMQNQANKLS
ncbi:MAG: DUF4234 domain-containing protein [Bacilli bacterium]|jgi:hypothetical protein|nr:DUF4234 domain-containing protein [Bacilli bacterium]MDY0064726.1 DUF4234 domain-containing protein [Bacilli bacterium]